LLALTTTLVIGTTLVGTSTLLTTRTAERSVEVAAARTEPDDVASTAYIAGITAANARSVAADTRSLLISSVAPFTATTVARASSAMRELPLAGADGGGYLAGIEDLPERAVLVAGRWPRAGASTSEAAILQSTARLLGLGAGDRVRLGAEFGRSPNGPVSVLVVGIVRPLQDAGWERDPLRGAGFDADPPESTSARPVKAYGPFLIDLDDLLSGGSALSRLQVSARPDLSDPTSRGLAQVTASLRQADRRLSGMLGDRIELGRFDSPLTEVLISARNQRQLTSSAILALSACLMFLSVTLG
jgi:hypothetical protein